MTFDFDAIRFITGIWLNKMAYWLGSEPMIYLFTLTCFVFLCKGIKVLLNGR